MLGDLPSLRDDRRARRRLDLEPGARGELDRAQDPDRILAKADRGVADGANQLTVEVIKPPDIVDDRKGGDVVEEPVDREVAAQGILLRRPKRVVAANEQVPVSLGELGLLPERRHLDDLLAKDDVGEPEAAPDEPGVSEKLLDLVGMGVRGDVEVLGLASDQHVADPAPHEVGAVAAIV